MKISTDVGILYILLQLFTQWGNRIVLDMSSLGLQSPERRALQEDYYVSLALCDRVATYLAAKENESFNSLSLMFDDEIEKTLLELDLLKEPILISRDNEVVEMTYKDITELLRKLVAPTDQV